MKKALYLIAVLILVSCQSDKTLQIPEESLVKLEEHKTRLLESRQKNYLSLVGLFKLEPGTQSFGSGESNTIQLDIVEMPEKLGLFEVTEDSITYLSTLPGEAQAIHMELDEVGNSQGICKLVGRHFGSMHTCPNIETH